MSENGLTNPQKIIGAHDRSARALFGVPIQAQEKVDGSFFSFGQVPEKGLVIRSKGHTISGDAGMFQLAVESVKTIASDLIPGWIYRGEAITKPRHNVLSYERIPIGGVILFDVLTGPEEYLGYEALLTEGKRLGLEVVPQLFNGTLESIADLEKLLDNVSILGKTKIEGVVIKPLTKVLDRDGKLLYVKYVSSAFKEVMKAGINKESKSLDDYVDSLVVAYGSEARFLKAVQHLKESGKVMDSIRDTGLVVKETIADIASEEGENIGKDLFNFVWNVIRKDIGRNAATWYQNYLIEQQEPAEVPVETAIAEFETDGGCPTA